MYKKGKTDIKVVQSNKNLTSILKNTENSISSTHEIMATSTVPFTPNIEETSVNKVR